MAWGIFSTFSIFIKTAQIKLLPWSGGKLNCISFQVTLVTSWKVIVTLKTSNGQWNHHSDDFKCPFADTSSVVIVQWYSNSKHIYIWINPLHTCPHYLFSVYVGVLVLVQLDIGADACCLVDVSHACPCPLSLGLVKCALGHWTIEVLSCAPCLVAPSLALWWQNMHLSQSGSCTTWLLSFLLNWPSR